MLYQGGYRWELPLSNVPSGSPTKLLSTKAKIQLPLSQWKHVTGELPLEGVSIQHFFFLKLTFVHVSQGAGLIPISMFTSKTVGAVV